VLLTGVEPVGTGSAYSGNALTEYGELKHSGRTTICAPALAASLMAASAECKFADFSVPTASCKRANLKRPGAGGATKEEEACDGLGSAARTIISRNAIEHKRGNAAFPRDTACLWGLRGVVLCCEISFCSHFLEKPFFIAPMVKPKSVQSVRPPATSRGVQKLLRSSQQLVGRRVSVPQRFTDVEDDGDGFSFEATIIFVDDDSKRALIKYRYTDEVESWRLQLVKSWLQPDVGNLSDTFNGSLFF
jgi:hypothetical protein